MNTVAKCIVLQQLNRSVFINKKLKHKVGQMGEFSLAYRVGLDGKSSGQIALSTCCS